MNKDKIRIMTLKTLDVSVITVKEIDCSKIVVDPVTGLFVHVDNTREEIDRFAYGFKCKLSGMGYSDKEIDKHYPKIKEI